ncbi:MAG: YggT family protein [Deltaproteobacteria bacterium]|nr:YggT family protein [Deltaproteobacteria bacterium]
MNILSDFIIILAKIIDVSLTVLYLLIIVRALLSWVNPDPYNPVVRFIYRVTEPILAPIRRIIPLGIGSGIDISPIIAFLLIMFLQPLVYRGLISLALSIR